MAVDLRLYALVDPAVAGAKIDLAATYTNAFVDKAPR